MYKVISLSNGEYAVVNIRTGEVVEQRATMSGALLACRRLNRLSRRVRVLA
jgi:hypothetical protein